MCTMAPLRAVLKTVSERSMDSYCCVCNFFVTSCCAATGVKKGDHVSMHYTGTIDESSEAGESGKMFDSSRGRGKTFDFNIGRGQVSKVLFLS